MPVIGIVLEVTMYVLLAAMLAGLVMQRRWGFLASFAAAVLATAASIVCPVTGHHSFGAWWFAQMACMLGLVAISVFALRSQLQRDLITRRSLRRRVPAPRALAPGERLASLAAAETPRLTATCGSSYSGCTATMSTT